VTRLSYADQNKPGLTRKKAGHGWAYFDPDGKRITDRDEIDRLNSIALPPAYTDAWFAPNPNAHLLAFGFDAKGRKQYRYHPDFRSTRESVKYDSLAAFGKALPKLRKRVAKDLAGRKLTRERAVASVVRLLDGGEIRVGNQAYAKSNKSFGATTLLMRHVKVKPNKLELRFRAKSGKEAQVEVTDKSLIRFVRAMQDLPGQHLFQYLNSDGEPCPVTSDDVNAYIREAMGQDFTAKHFRTWAASVCGYSMVLKEERHIGVKELATEVSCRLNNTPAVSRKSYIHPAVTALAQDPKAQAKVRAKARLPRARKFMTAHERAFLTFIAKAPRARTLLAKL
jgi:DNA topoisomerase-1